MRPLYRNLFLGIGVISIVAMLFSFDMPWNDAMEYLRRAGVFFPVIVLLWMPIYMMNAWAWKLILDGEESVRVGYWRIFRYTISGYALNNVTPVGLLGGEPYRIMALTPVVGATRATSSVVLYSMMHIFSHFCFWTFSIVLFLLAYFDNITVGVGLFLFVVSLFCFIGIYFFMLGYRNGLVRKLLAIFSHLPFCGQRINQFSVEKADAIIRVDSQIASLHAQRRSVFYSSLFLEFMARIIGCVEIMLCLYIFSPNASFVDCILMQAFMSLLANLMFFIPMQMGTREGGFAIVTSKLCLSGAIGVMTGLITRLRELIWDTIGILMCVKK